MKLRDNPRFWLILRIAFFALVAWGALAGPGHDQGLNWREAWLLPPATGVFLYVWINMFGWRQEADLSDSLTLTKPFWSTFDYPTRFWALFAHAGLIGGGLAIVREIGAGEAVTPGSVYTLGTGIAIALAIWVAGLMMTRGSSDGMAEPDRVSP